MGTITLPNFRVSGTDRARVRLKDGGVYVEWSTMTDIKAWLYSVEQKAISGRFDVRVDPQDGTRLLCVYSAQKPQYLGVNKIILQCKYEGAEKAYDKPLWNFVRWTDDQAGEEVTIDDPEVDVEIVAEDISSSVLDEATAAALSAADKANEAAEQIPLEVLTQARQATQEALEAKEEADAAAEHATPYIGENGHWWRWSKEAGEYVDTGDVAQGPTGNGIQSVEQTTESQESEGENVVTVTMTNGSQAQFSIRNGKQGERGLQGVPGVANAKYKQVDTLPTASVDTMGFIYLTPTQTAGVYDMSYTEQDGNTYTWKPLGTTAIQLADYATKAEVSQLQQKVDGTQANYVENYKLNASNELIQAEGYAVTDFVPYTAGNDVLWRFDTANRQYYILFYNSNKEFINGSDWTADYDSTNQGRLIPSSQINSYARGAAYLRATFTIAYTDAQVKVGNEVRWTPQAEIVSLTEKVADADDKASKAVSFVGQELSPSEQKVARENIALDERLYGSTLNYISNVRITQGVIWEEAGMCVTDFIPIKNGDEVIWNFGVVGQANYTLCLYDENKDYSNFYSSNNYVGSRTVIISGDTYKYLRATFKKTAWNGQKNNFPIVVNGVYFPYKDNVPSFFEDIKKNLDDCKRWKPLVIGGLVNSDTTSNGHLVHSDYYDSLRVTTKSVVAPPFPGARIRFRFVGDVPYTLSCYFFVGDSSDVMSTSWVGYKRLYSGDEITLPNSARSIRPVFRASDSATGYTVAILASTIQEWIDGGILALEYYDEYKADVNERNVALDVNMAALRRKLIWSNMAENGMDSMPVFAHITDLHGDATRFDNFLTYCDRNRVDFALETGDALMHQRRDSSKFVFDIADKHNTEVLACIGNHESLPTGSDKLFDDNISELATKYGYLAAAGTETTKCYYYKDFDSKKIRVIVLNQYEDGVYAMRLGQTQISWFVATLASIPEGYGVVVILHAPDDAVVADSPYNTFFQPVPHSTSYTGGYYVDKRAISMIVDAFISRTAISFTFNDHSATYNGDTDLTTENISVSADFTAVNPDTEFICYVCGHRHEDRIGYFENSVNKQLCLEITCGSALYGDASNPAWSNQSDLPRGGVGVSQDAFCIYAIDRLNGNVKVMRVGATVTQMMVKREMMIIPYKD